jgi:hypothetical protein
MTLGDDREPGERHVLGVLNEEIENRFHATVVLLAASTRTGPPARE